jgi:hypothetical protein
MRFSVVSLALVVLGTRLRWRGVIEERRDVNDAILGRGAAQAAQLPAPFTLSAAISIYPHILLAASTMDLCKIRLELAVDRLDLRMVFLKLREVGT